jgi:hypothetical protein
MEFNKMGFGFLLPMYPPARRKGLKRYPFARFGLPGKRYREPPVPRKARSGRGPDAPNIKLYIFKSKAVYFDSLRLYPNSLLFEWFGGFVVILN